MRPIIIASDRGVIDALGGPSAVRDLIRAKFNIKMTPQNVSNWRRHGIPWRYRRAIHGALAERGIILPEDFIEHRRVA